MPFSTSALRRWSERVASRSGTPPISMRLAAAPTNPPGGIVGAAASRMLIGGVPEREAMRSLQRLKALLEDGT